MTFRFDPIPRRPCTGRFEFSGPLLLQVFSALGDELTPFGLRHFEADGKSAEVGMFDSRREGLQAICARIGRGDAAIGDLQSICQNGTGYTINSPQVESDDDPFQTLSDLFVSGLHRNPGSFPEKIYTTFYFGTYESGFGLHADVGEDTALFVLDGTKDFVLLNDEGNEVRYAIEKGGYLAWDAGRKHSALNPNRNWSFTMNFAVGSPGVDGPVRYQSEKTQRIFPYIK